MYLHRLKDIVTDNCNVETHFGSPICDDSVPLFNSGMGKIWRFCYFQKYKTFRQTLEAHCCGADWINKTIKKKRIRQGSVILLYSEIREDDNDLIRPFILETKDDPGA